MVKADLEFEIASFVFWGTGILLHLKVSSNNGKILAKPVTLFDTCRKKSPILFCLWFTKLDSWISESLKLKAKSSLSLISASVYGKLLFISKQ